MGVLLGVALAGAVGFFLGRYGVTVGRFSPPSVITGYDMSFRIRPRRLLLSGVGWAVGPMIVSELVLRRLLPTWTDYFGIERVRGWPSLILYASALAAIWLGLIVKHRSYSAIPGDLRKAIQEVGLKQDEEFETFAAVYGAPNERDIRRNRASLLLQAAREQGLLTEEDLSADVDTPTLESVSSAFANHLAQVGAPDDYGSLLAAYAYVRKSYELVRRLMKL